MLQGLRTQIPHKHIQAPPMSMNTSLIPPDTPQKLPRHPPDISREDKKPTDNNRRQQTLPDTLKWHLSVSWGVCDCLFMSVGTCCRLLASCVYWRCLGGVWGMSGGVWGDKNGIHGHWRRLDVFVGYMGSQSLQYGATTIFWQNPERHNFSLPGRIETSKYQNVHI